MSNYDYHIKAVNIPRAGIAQGLAREYGLPLISNE